MDGFISPLWKCRHLPESLVGLVGLAGARLHGSKIHQRWSILGVDGQRLAKLLLRLRRSAVAEVEVAQIEPGFRRFR